MVTVIIVVYNAEKYLKSAINSVVEQTYRDLEIIVVDDGSTDSTLDILNEYIHLQNFSLIKRNHTKNLGGNRNYALQFAKGDMIAFIDGDDIWNREKLEVQVPFLMNYDMICSNSTLINENDEVLAEKYKNQFKNDVELGLSDLLADNIVTVSSVLMKKSAIEKAGFFEDGPDTRAEDYVLWLSYLGDSTKKVRYLNNPTLKYRIHDKNWSNSTITDWNRLLERTIEIRSAYLHSSDEKIRKGARAGCLSSYLMLAKAAYKQKKFRDTRKYLKKVVEMYDGGVSFKLLKYSLACAFISFISLFKK